MGSLKRRPAFDPRELEIIDRVYNAAWAQILTRHSGRNIGNLNERQRALRRRLFILADKGPVEFHTLRDRLLATMPEALMSYARR
jgi:predicted phosphoadenosine phosphosulfate sulfurtransferase